MIFLSFEWEKISPDELLKILEACPTDHLCPDGDFIRVRRPDRVHYYTHTNAKVLEDVRRHLYARTIPFTEVDEKDLPDYARKALAIYREAQNQAREES